MVLLMPPSEVNGSHVMETLTKVTISYQYFAVILDFFSIRCDPTTQELYTILLKAVLNHKILVRVKSTSDRGDMKQGRATVGVCFCCVSIIGW